jgi:hypothetical protein
LAFVGGGGGKDDLQRLAIAKFLDLVRSDVSSQRDLTDVVFGLPQPHTEFGHVQPNGGEYANGDHAESDLGIPDVFVT